MLQAKEREGTKELRLERKLQEEKVAPLTRAQDKGWREGRSLQGLGMGGVIDGIPGAMGSCRSYSKDQREPRS